MAIIDIHALSPNYYRFDPGAHQTVTRSAKRSGDGINAVNLVVHPLYFQKLLEAHPGLFGYPPLNRLVQEIESQPNTAFIAYQKRLEAYLKTTLLPIFIFAAPEARLPLTGWIETLGPAAPVVMLNTLSAFDPTPLLGERGTRADPAAYSAELWTGFGEILHHLGINRIFLMGEIFYEMDVKFEEFSFSGKCGCVGKAHDSLESFRRAKALADQAGEDFPFPLLGVELQRRLTYPNVIYRLSNPEELEAFLTYVKKMANKNG